MADSWAPAYELSGAISTVTSAYVVTGLLDRWFLQGALPVSNTSAGQWLMDQVGYAPPRDRLTPGREYPRT